MAKTTKLMDKYDTFIFDWDGTLNSVKLLMFLNEKLNPVKAMIKRSQAHTTMKITNADVKRLVKRKESRGINIGRELFSPVIDLSIYLLTPKLHNGSREALQKLISKRKKVAMFTNGAPYRVLRELRYLGIEDYFEAIVSAQEIKALKPNPLGLELIMKAVGAEKKKTIYIGDMVDDILVARSAGIASCAFSCGFDTHTALERAGPDYIFRSIEEFEKAL